MAITIKLKYFAQLRELAEKSDELLQTEAVTPHQIYAEIKNRYRFPFAEKDLRVAVNGNFASFDELLKDYDLITFIPPVAGG